MPGVKPRLRRLAPALIAVLAAWAGGAAAEPPADLDAQVARLMTAAGAPGVAVGIVEGGRPVLAKGYGVRRLGGAEPVDARTLFQIGSTTKAMTVAALAVLVDEGKLRWDDRVIDHLPEFQMMDPWVTREFTVRDLLTHRSGLGLGAGDLMFMGHADFSRAEIVHALRFLKPQTSFRSTFAYDNLLYVVAGEVVARVSGQTWEGFVRDRVLHPAGMAGSTTDGAWLEVADHAEPHARLGPPFAGEGSQTRLDTARGLSANAAPAGGVASSAEDMTRWIALQLAHGAPAEGARVWSEAQAREMWSPVTPLPLRPPQGPMAEAAPRFAAYALGWNVQDYRGERVVWHAGGTEGFLTRVVLLPDRGVGFVILQNSLDGELIGALQNILLDHYIGAAPVDWAARFREAHAKTVEQARAALASPQDAPSGPPPKKVLPGAAGEYKDAWYGRVELRVADGGMRLTFPRTPQMTAVLEPRAGTTYVARWRDPALEPAYVTFAPGADGRIAHVLLRPVSPLADFSFDYQDLDLVPLGGRR